jgi:hypothetical protein
MGGPNSSTILIRMTTTARIRKKRRMSRCGILVELSSVTFLVVYKWKSMHVAVHEVPTWPARSHGAMGGDDWIQKRTSYMFLDMASSQGDLALSFRKMGETEQEQQCCRSS